MPLYPLRRGPFINHLDDPCLFKGSWNLSKRSRPSFRFDSRWLQEDEPLLLEGDVAKYVVVFDPLDGSSNIDASIPTGACLRRGRGEVAAFGSSMDCPGFEQRSEDYLLGFFVHFTLSLGPGTIFGVYLADQTKTALENTLQPGNRLVAGGYCLYSSSTVRRVGDCVVCSRSMRKVRKHKRSIAVVLRPVARCFSLPQAPWVSLECTVVTAIQPSL